MSINVFFALLLGLLMAMYASFAPVASPEQQTREIPKIELHDFTLYEISQAGIDHVLEGKEGKKFEERYEITSAKFSDNTTPLFQSIYAGNALYQNDVLHLDTNVLYQRTDGVEFRSSEAKYNTKTAVVTTEGTFVITQSGNRVEGKRLHYNTEQDAVSADAVRGSYQLN